MDSPPLGYQRWEREGGGLAGWLGLSMQSVGPCSHPVLRGREINSHNQPPCQVINKKGISRFEAKPLRLQV